MTFPSRAHRPTLTLVSSADDREAEELWREACCEFLCACFNGDTKSRLQFFAARVFRARNAVRTKANA